MGRFVFPALMGWVDYNKNYHKSSIQPSYKILQEKMKWKLFYNVSYKRFPAPKIHI